MNGQIKLKNGKSVVLMKYHALKCMWHKKQSVNPSIIEHELPIIYHQFSLKYSDMHQKVFRQPVTGHTKAFLKVLH